MTELDASATGRTLDVDGDRIHYHDVGDGEPLVIQQAFGPLAGTTAWLTYHKVIAGLSARYRCILLDFPNFGRSSPVLFQEPVHDLYVRNTFAVMDALRIDAARVLGISTGGTVALDMALHSPERVTKVVVGGCNASTGGDPGILAPSPCEVLRLFEENQGEPADRGKIRRLLRALVHDHGLVEEMVIDALYDWRIREPEHAATWARSVSVPHSNLGELHTIGIPALVVHGRHDRMVSLEQALLLSSYLPSADLVVLDNCGHWPPFERPGDFLRFVLPFLADDPVPVCGSP
jgi:pimeloyl-ACP methyl ester carboxylesterase